MAHWRLKIAVGVDGCMVVESKSGYVDLPGLTWRQHFLPFLLTCSVLKVVFNSAF